jgi:hypothetical protein
VPAAVLSLVRRPQGCADPPRRPLAALTSQVAAFGGNPVRSLLQLIQQHAHRFSAPPIGPIGAHLRLVDNSWGKAVEGALGQVLDGFICANDADLKLLYQLARPTGAKIQVFTTDFSAQQYK